jgi:hypothetical protein
MICEAIKPRLPHALQVLRAGPNNDMGESSGMEASGVAERSKRVAITTPA